MVHFVCIHMHKLQTLQVQTSKWTPCVCARARTNFKRLASIHGILNHIVVIWRYFRLFNGFSDRFVCVCVVVLGIFYIRNALNVYHYFWYACRFGCISITQMVSMTFQSLWKIQDLFALFQSFYDILVMLGASRVFQSL